MGRLERGPRERTTPGWAQPGLGVEGGSQGHGESVETGVAEGVRRAQDRGHTG